jgi:hypothetical protein
VSRRAPIASIRSGVARMLRRCLPVLVHRPPRSGVSPSRSLVRERNRRAPRMGPEAPVWTPVVCPTRRKPGARQPEQYALDPGIGQIPPTGRPVRLISSDTASSATTLYRRTAPSYSRVRYVGMTVTTSTYAAWKCLSGRPGGSRLVFGGGDGTSSVFLLGAAARGANGAGRGRGAGTEVVHGVQGRAFTTGQIKRQRGGLSSPVIRCNPTVRALRDSLEHHEAAKYLEVRPRCQMLVTPALSSV